jgi:predicted GNAT family acetyltransferase
MTYDITHSLQESRFHTEVDGHECMLNYSLHNGVMTIRYTGVPPSVGGRGIAAELTRAALDSARSNAWKVVPLCSYAAAYIRRHAEYADLLN